jgi:predicted aspartyl protease
MGDPGRSSVGVLKYSAREAGNETAKNDAKRPVLTAHYHLLSP